MGHRRRLPVRAVPDVRQHQPAGRAGARHAGGGRRRHRRRSSRSRERNTGIRRAEIEGQQDRVRADPALLARGGRRLRARATPARRRWSRSRIVIRYHGIEAAGPPALHRRDGGDGAPWRSARPCRVTLADRAGAARAGSPRSARWSTSSSPPTSCSSPAGCARTPACRASCTSRCWSAGCCRCPRRPRPGHAVFWVLLVAGAGRGHAAGRRRLLGWTVFLLYLEWMIIAMSYGKVDHDRFALLVALAVAADRRAARGTATATLDRGRRLGAAGDPVRGGRARTSWPRGPSCASAGWTG